MTERKNINRGYKKLIVWQDAAELYVLTCNTFRKFQFELRRVASNQIASVDSVHRNIALGSLGESVSGANVYRKANQISEQQFEAWDALAYKLENGMKKLIESLQYKRQEG